MKRMTILDLVYRLNAISIETNKIEMAMLHDSENPELQSRLDTLNTEHNTIIRELCGRIPSLEGDKNLQPKTKTKGGKLL